jgi:hypothetical protein
MASDLEVMSVIAGGGGGLSSGEGGGAWFPVDLPSVPLPVTVSVAVSGQF